MYDGYPVHASYKSQWHSRADGTFPTNVWLPALNYHLSLAKTNYCERVFTNVIVNPSPGEVTNLGKLRLFPVDTNKNELADRWEERYFGGGTNGAPNEDADGDGHNNRQEYQVGTDPTNQNSVLKLHITAQTTNGILLTWPVAIDRTYNIKASGRLTSGLWTQTVFGPCEAAYSQTQMQWAVTNTAARSNGFYRIALPVP